MKPFGPTFYAELETDRRIGADFAHGAPKGKEFLCIKEHARLIDKSLGKPGSAQDCRGTDSQFFQLRKGAARDAKVLVLSVYTDLREAMSMEERYFTSDLRSLS